MGNNTKQKFILYSSAEIHSCIKKLFSEPNKSDRRVALVAYIGGDGESYLPHPEGLHLICSPSAGGTSPVTIRKLMLRKAKVQFSDGLHMKVYWSRQRGCLITSANASSNALGRHGLKEAGVFLPSARVDIDRFIRYAKPRNVTAWELRKLDASTKKQSKDRDQYGRKQETLGYPEWFASPHRSNWKLCWGEEIIGGTAQAVADVTRSEYGMRVPQNWWHAAKRRVKPNDWLLCFIFTKSGIKDIEWLYVDFLVKISPKEKKYYCKEWPFHVVQVHQTIRYALPPFEISGAFKSAFSRALVSWTRERVKGAKTDKPSAKLLKLIADEMGQSGE